MDNLTLARLEIPDGALLLYEQMAIRDPDRSGNWRFLVRADGGFYHARNTRLWVTDPALLASDDPTLFWNTPFPATPARALSPQQRDELERAIRTADFPALARRSPFTPRGRVSDPSVERWSAILNGETHSVVVESGAAPPELVTLRATVDALVAAAP